MAKAQTSIFDARILRAASIDAFRKLDPRLMIRNPVMFVLEVVAALTTVLLVRDLVVRGTDLGFSFQIVLWLWFTVLFANFAEAVAEGRGKAQAESLAQDPDRHPGEGADRRFGGDRRSAHGRMAPDQPEGRRRGAGRGGRDHPVRRRGDRGRRLGQRSGHHGRSPRPSSARAAAIAPRSRAARR